MRHAIWKRLGYLAYLFAVTFIVLEILLRLYNPFQFRLKYNKLILPISQQQVIKNTINDKLDATIINRRNALGFRGEEKPADFSTKLSIITVGGSTTECHFLSEGKTWPDMVAKGLKSMFKNTWLNNAGFDGHSTFGHQVLLNDHLKILKPKVVLFLVGINDIENDQPTFHDKLNTKGAYADFKHFIFTNSEVLNLGLNLVRGWRSQRVNNTTHYPINLIRYDTLVLSDAQQKERLAIQDKYLPNFQRRIGELIDTCQAYGILPVFLTQPNLAGVGKDSITGANLETIDVGDHLNGKLLWNILERYNIETIKTCQEKGVDVIDIARQLPKSSLYFYDVSHYTNEGARKLATIITPALTNILRQRFPGYYFMQ
jgi:lysophospholipase L1-like esterase